MSARAGALAALLLTALVHGAAHAQCPADDLNQASALALPPELDAIVGAPPARTKASVWSDTAERIDRLRRRAHDEAARTHLRALDALAELLGAILEGYDGTEQTAHRLRFADAQPRACGVDPQTELPSCAWEILGGQVQVPLDARPPWSCAVKTEFLGYVVAAQRLIARVADPSVAEAAEDLGKAATAWKRYVERGFSQYPHEVLLNGLLMDEDSWGPPRHQLIAAHAAVGIGTANMREAGGGRREGAMVLVVEALGYVLYLDGFRHHLGASVAGVLPNFAWGQVALGPMLHFDGIGVGYGFGLKGDQPETLFVTFDVTRGIDDGMLGKHAKRWVRDRLE
ncbi:MAG: hypothetical protein ABW252_13525 [Polyangiales bacterium]